MRRISFGLLCIASSVGCSGEEEASEVVCDGQITAVPDPGQPAGGLDFPIGPTIAEMSGSFEGTVQTPDGEGPIALEVSLDGVPWVVEGDSDCADSRYRLDLWLALSASPGIDAAFGASALLGDPNTRLALTHDSEQAESGVSLTDPAMGDEVVITLTHRYEQGAWEGEITWQPADGGASSPLASWSAAR